GLKVINNQGKIIREYTIDQIGSNMIKSIVEDKMGNMWIGTDIGLCSISLDDTTINYTISDGLPARQFNYGAAFSSEDGVLYFGATSGLVSFSAQKMNRSTPKFNLKITNIYVNRESSVYEEYNRLSQRNKSNIQSLELNHNEARSVRIEFSGLNYKYETNTHYAIKLEGMDEKWQNMGNYNRVSFSNLRAGSYKLLIKASGDGVNWDEDSMVSLKMKVQPSLWLSWGAMIIYLLIIILIIRVLYSHTKARLLLNMQLKSEHNERLNIERINLVKSNFFAFVSHDLKTPLTLVLSPLQRIIKQEKIGDCDRDKLQKIYSNASRMNYLIDELLTVSKIEMQQMQIKVQRGNIMQFISEISHLFDIVAEEKGIEFIVKLDKNEDMVWFSPPKLERIIYNLLSNAFKYSDQGGRVLLTATFEQHNQKKMVVVEVEDSGRGIPEDRLESIFESYTQVAENDNRTGFGLGLSLTKSLVNIHKGTISVKSKEAFGSTFTVNIDVTELSYDASQRSDESTNMHNFNHINTIIEESVKILPENGAKADSTLNSIDTMLIVDDNRDMNDYLVEIFKDKYKIIRAYDGKEALDRIKESMPNFILCDVMMPNMNGVEFTKILKEDISTSHIPIIMLTAKSDQKDFTEGYLAGADYYISKPFNSEHLELMVENMQNTRRRNFQRFQQQDEVIISEVVTNSRDEKFMSEILALINVNMGNEEFGVQEIVENMNISRTLIHNKIKALTGVSITYFIRGIRMKEAKRRLLEGVNISEVAYSVGYSDPNYFTKCFKKEFNLTPREYITSLKENNTKNF
ncbi:MAG: hybrid sensor histidine kinase/response regulator transcription factor, partial [Rikenellaceae bacterium]